MAVSVDDIFKKSSIPTITQQQVDEQPQEQPQPLVVGNNPDDDAAKPSFDRHERTTIYEGNDDITPGQHPRKPLATEGALSVDLPTTLPTLPKKVETYPELYARLNQRNAPETDEEKAQREKRERRNAMFSAIGDGISALSNLYFTTKGAPSSYDASNSLSERAKARYDQHMAQRNAREDAWRQGMYNAYLKQKEADWTDAKLEAQNRREDAKEQRADDEAKRKERELAIKEIKADNDTKKNNLYLLLLEKKINQATYDEMIKKIDADTEQAYRDALIAKQYRSGSGGGSKATSEWLATDADGNKHTIKASSTANAYSIAVANGWTIGAPVQVSEREEQVTNVGTTQVKKSTSTKRTDTGTQTQNKPQTAAQQKDAAAQQKPKKKTGVKWS